jgi:hypothetical protein
MLRVRRSRRIIPAILTRSTAGSALGATEDDSSSVSQPIVATPAFGHLGLRGGDPKQVVTPREEGLQVPMPHDEDVSRVGTRGRISDVVGGLSAGCSRDATSRHVVIDAALKGLEFCRWQPE